MRYGMKDISENALEFDIPMQWAISRRKLFLETEINYLEQHQKTMAQLMSGATSQDRDFIFASIIQCSKEIQDFKREIYFITQNDKIKNEITDEMIERAKGYPLSQLLEVKNNMALCINHAERNPSMDCRNNFAYCYSCNWRGDSIDVAMKLHAINFIDAVKSLQ